MAGFKVSEFSGVADTTDDSLLLLSYTTDSGATYATRKIRIADFLDDIPPTTKADLDVDDLETLTGAGVGATNLGTFTGTTISDNEAIKGALQDLETALETKQAALTGGNGIDVTSNTVTVDLTAPGTGDITVAGYSSAQGFVNGTYTLYTGFSGTISGTAGTSTMTWATNSSYNVYTDSVSAKLIAYNTTESSWMIAFCPSGVGTPSNGGTVTVSTSGYDLPTADSITVDGKSSPDATNWSEATYGAAGSEPFLEFDGGELRAKVKDEDNMASDSDEHLATQQSIKAYVDTQVTALGVSVDQDYIHKDGSLAFTADQSMGGFKLTTLGTPTVSTDAATKAYVDSATSGQGAFWVTVRVETHSYGNVDLSTGGLLTIDGITLVAGDRVLAEDQTDDTENGIYVAASGAWSRASDADQSAEFTTNKTVYTSEGTNGQGNVHAYTGVDNPTLGTDSIIFLKKQESAGIADGSITTIKLADGAVTNAKVTDVDASKLTGTLADARVAESNVTQHEAALTLAASQVTSGAFADARISESSVTQHQAALVITESQISDLGDYATNAKVDEIDADVNDLITLSGVAENATSLGTFTGSTLDDSETVKSAFQALETAVETLQVSDLTDGGNVVEAGDNVNRLVGSTGSDGEPASYLFMVVDQSDGAIKFIDKTFIEIE